MFITALVLSEFTNQTSFTSQTINRIGICCFNGLKAPGEQGNPRRQTASHREYPCLVLATPEDIGYGRLY
jgi:hypothetical protein